MKKTLILPHYIMGGMRHNEKSLNKTVRVFGGDTETCNGEPFTLQLCGADRNPEIFWVNKSSVLDTFLDYADRHISRNELGAFYFHNLDFDLVALLYGYDFTKFKDTEFVIKRKGWTINVFCGKRYFAKLTKQGHKSVYIIDSAAFLPFSLKKIGKELKLPVQKLSTPGDPKTFGEVKFMQTDPEFCQYAKRDAEVEYLIGEWILKIHRQYDTALSVSLPQLAGYIFRHHFLRPEDRIKLPSSTVIKAALLSYHGGKNGKYVESGRYKNCSEIDLNSAYAYAMKCLPSFLDGEYFEAQQYDPSYEGIYCISGETSCPYNIFFDHEFKPLDKTFESLWVTSYELAEAMKYNEVTLKSCWGYLWRPESIRNPFGDYVDYFYEKKQSTNKEDSLYTFYKLAMNALYGKTIQAVELNNKETRDADFEMDFDEKENIKLKRVNKTYRAGGLFNPFIATLITGKVRAMIHDLEHRFKALHTATDSIKTQLHVTGCSNELGGYKLEVKGTCLLFRNKLYLHYNEKDELKKFALHGFSGNTEDLLKLYRSKGRLYTINHLFKIKEALIQKKIPLAMVKGLERQLNMDWTKFKE